MKLNDIIVEFKNSEDGHQDPAHDKQGRAFKTYTRKPVISLRHINRLKKLKAAKMEEFEERQKLMSVMYALPDEGEEGI